MLVLINWLVTLILFGVLAVVRLVVFVNEAKVEGRRRKEEQMEAHLNDLLHRKLKDLKLSTLNNNSQQIEVQAKSREILNRQLKTEVLFGFSLATQFGLMFLVRVGLVYYARSIYVPALQDGDKWLPFLNKNHEFNVALLIQYFIYLVEFLRHLELYRQFDYQSLQEKLSEVEDRLFQLVKMQPQIQDKTLSNTVMTMGRNDSRSSQPRRSSRGSINF
jgi:ABC-type multidrug transport system fused ATPase/permease subunit